MPFSKNLIKKNQVEEICGTFDNSYFPDKIVVF